MTFRVLPAALLLVSCQGNSASESQTPVRAVLELRNARDDLTASVSPGRPCRAVVDGVELQIGGRPLVTMVGAVRWAGEDDPTSGTTFLRDGVRTARLFPTDPAATSVAVFDAEGVPMLRASLAGDTASIVDRSGAVVRTARRTPAGITLGDLKLTGTDDLLLAALISAPELLPEVRALAACHRLLPPQKVTN